MSYKNSNKYKELDIQALWRVTLQSLKSESELFAGDTLDWMTTQKKALRRKSEDKINKMWCLPL